MANPRVHEVASELGVDSAVVLARLQEFGEFARGPASAIAPPVARRVIESFGRSPAAPGTDRSPVGRAGLDTPSVASRRPRSSVSASALDESDVLNADPRAPSSRQYGWHSNPVTEPKHPDLLRQMAVAEKRFRVLASHREAMARLGSQIVYMAPAKDPVLSDSAVALVRFSGAIESAFGFTREVMVLYTPFPDLQVRTYEAAFRELKALNRNVTADILFLWSADRRAAVKLNDWSAPGQLAIPFEFNDTDPMALVELLREHLHVRDLFNETTPVSGAKFFGRKTLLQALREDVLSQSVAGIFGLRKAGKTSVLLQLRQNLERDNVLSVLVDLETYPSPPDDPVDDILADVRRRILEELRRKNLSLGKLGSIPEYPSILQFKNALHALAHKLERDGVQLLLMLDEIEYLTPSDRIDIAEGEMPRIAQFLSALRSVVQETSNFTFLLSGLTSTILESGRLYGRPNPMFSWAKSRYVGPLERVEADRLATAVGARMGIEIDPAALSALYDASGGHAYLYRNLASAVVTTLSADVMNRRITRAMVLRQLSPWVDSVRGNVHEMLDHVGRYYPTEVVLLELIREHPGELAALVREEPEAARRLRNLGLLRTVEGADELSVLLDLA